MVETSADRVIIDDAQLQTLTKGPVQVPNNHILTQNLYNNHYYPKLKSLIIGFLDPLGKSGFRAHMRLRVWSFGFRAWV